MKSPKSGLDDYFANLAGEGTTEARGLGFTLESAKAREKLAEFALLDAGSYQLLAVSGLYALGARKFELTIDADDFVILADSPLERAPFLDLWSFVSRASEESLVAGCRLLAMALLTSLRLGDVDWVVQSADAAGPWEFTAGIRRGKLTEQPVRPASHGQSGVRVWAKRKSLSQVARRYLSRMLSKHHPADESLVRQRLFLPQGATLVINEKPVAAVAQGQNVLAVLETGQALRLVDGPIAHRLERDYSVSLLLCHPESGGDSALPGQANHVQWIWNGLRMDSTVLGVELDCFRAFVWAPDLRPDLSFRSLVGNREKQALERNVRSLARELLDRYVRELSAQLQSSPRIDSGRRFAAPLSLVRKAIVERIDLRRDASRLASLNRALIDCPLIPGSAADGKRRWVPFREIWTTLAAGRPVAAFAGDVPAPSVPAWPDRPLVLYSNAQEHAFLRQCFPQARFPKGEAILEQVGRLVPKAPAQTFESPEVEADLAGATTVDGRSVRWTLHLPRDPCEPRAPKRAETISGLLVKMPDGPTYTDRTLGLPAGFLAQVEADWKPTYQGTLASPEQREWVKAALLGSLCQEVAGRSAGSPSKDDHRLSAALLRGLGTAPPVDPANWRHLECLQARTLDGEPRWVSPSSLLAEWGRMEAPPYVMDWDERPEYLGAPLRWLSLPVVLAPADCHEGLTSLLGQPPQSAGGLRLLLARPKANWPGAETLLWQGRLQGEEAGELSPRLQSLSMGVVAHKPRALRKARLRTSIETHLLGESKIDWFLPSLLLAVDWRDGWPDSAATQRLGVPSEETAAILRRGCLLLGARLFQEASPATLLQISPELVGTLAFDLLSEPETAHLAVFVTGAGEKVCLRELPSEQGRARYFDTPGPFAAERGREIYLPEPLREGLALLSSLSWTRTAAHTPSAPPVAEQPIAPRKPSVVTMPGKSPRPTPTAGQPEPPPALLPMDPAPLSREPVPPATNPPADPRPSPPETPEAPERMPAMPGSSPLGQVPQGVEALLAELQARFPESAAPHANLFEGFLRKVILEQQSPTALRLLQGRVVLGGAAVRALGTSPGRAQLLSALYSVFNRQHPEVADLDERKFHALLVASLRPGLG